MSTLNSGTRQTAKAAFIFFFSADLQIAQSFPPLFSLNQYDALLHDEADGTEVFAEFYILTVLIAFKMRTFTLNILISAFTSSLCRSLTFYW